MSRAQWQPRTSGRGEGCWRPGWDIGLSKHPKTPEDVGWEGSQAAPLLGRREVVGPRRAVCAAGAQALVFALCLAHHFSCMNPNPELHLPLHFQDQATLSRLFPAPYEMQGLLQESRRESLFTGTGSRQLSWSSDWDFVLEHRVAFLHAGACPHPHWCAQCPEQASTFKSYLMEARGASFAAR